MSTLRDPNAIFSGRSDMARLMRDIDWEKTHLGPVGTWPQSLRSALGICLHSPFPIAIYWGEQLALLYNDAWSPIPGKKHPWALGRAGREVWPEIWDTIGPLFERVTTSGEGTLSEDQLLPMRRHGYTEECYFNFTFTPIFGEKGRVEGVFNAVVETTFRVIGERRTRTLRELGESLARARSAQHACQLAAEALGKAREDVPFALIYLVEHDRKGATLEGSIGLSPGTAASPTRIDPHGSAPSAWPIANALKTRKPEVVHDLEEYGLPGGAWQEPTQSAIVVPIVSPTHPDAPAGILVAGISPRRALDDEYRAFYDRAAVAIAAAISNARAFEEERARAEKLAELDRAKTAFFSNVSHELRTPLTLMLGPIQEALQSGPPPEMRDSLLLAERNSLRLLKLVNSLLEFTRLEAGRVEARYLPTRLGEFTAELASSFESAARSAGLALELDIEDEARIAYVDRDMWEKIVLNLLSNAFKFTFEGGIRVSLRHEADHVHLTVSDTGVGIPESELPRLFERFHRVEGARSRTHEGSGIGLALVQELVRLHGGTIHAASRKGEGTTFDITIREGYAHLPPERVEHIDATAAPSGMASGFAGEALRWLPEPGASGPHAPVPIPPGGHARILLADDNADMRAYVGRLLSPHWSVEVVSDGAQALDRALADPPELVLSDVMMPTMNGFELVRRLRADARTRAVPIILLSARAGEDSRIEGIDRGADDYLTKPFTARELLARVHTHLELGRIRAAALQAEREARETTRRLNEDLEARVQEQTTTLEERARILQEANDSLSSFSYVVGHDLKEPVRAIGTILHVIQNDHAAEATPAHQRLIEAAVRANDRLGRLVTGLLEYSRAANAPLEEAVPTTIQAALDDAVQRDDVDQLLRDRPVEVRTEGLGTTIHAPPSALSLAIANILANALQHNLSPRPRVGIQAFQRANDTIEVILGDDGPGFSEELLAEFNAGGYGTRQGGFGLAIAKRTIERLGGSLSLGRSHLGGAAVHLILPTSARTRSSVQTDVEKRSEARLREVAEALDQRVRERTESLHQANADLETFTNTASHDLRAPLRATEFQLAELEAALARGQSADAIEHAKRARSQNARAQRLVHDLLSFALSSRKKISTDDVDLSSLVRELVLECEERHPERRVEFQIQPDMRVRADPALIRIALNNLISNASKYSSSKPDARVRVTSRVTPDATIVTVEDNGVGFPADEAARLFQPFTRLSTAQGHEGVGLGLAMVHRIITRHGGTIRAESTEGQGAAFHVTLPRGREGVSREPPDRAGSVHSGE
ncbi:MAG TPA: ATP-binding protein [Candidatus Thermoplasmatota archaeon]|nr:ATP-binding protein [Candidatus Thermoplasmatota archaeon]